MLERLTTAYNYAEVAIWPAIGLVLALYAFRRPPPIRRDCLIAAATLLLFGASDWFEAKTGNEWWNPPWLLAWKAGCILILLTLLLNAHRRRQPPTPKK